MGEYWKPVNLTRKEYINPHDFGCGLKKSEWAFEGSPVLNEIVKRWQPGDVVVHISDGGKLHGRDGGMHVPEYSHLDDDGYRKVGPNVALEQTAYDLARAREARARIAADNGLPVERVHFDEAAHFDAAKFDEVFLLGLDRQLADAVTFLPPAMRASFHAQVGALIRLVTTVSKINHERAINGIERAVDVWRTDRARIAERTR